MGVYVQHQDKWVFPAAVQGPYVLISAPGRLPTFLLLTEGQR